MKHNETLWHHSVVTGSIYNLYDAGALYYIAPIVETFLRDVWQIPNQLLNAVLADLSTLQYIAGCKALGIITGQLWRVLEGKDVTTLDINKRFRRLLSCFKDWSYDHIWGSFCL